jgi:cyclic di-GMP phosphodiesterase Gmr
VFEAHDGKQLAEVVTLDAIPAVVLILDAYGRVVEFNRAAQDLSGYRREDVVGRSLWETELIPEEEQSGTQDCLAKLCGGRR